MQQTQSLAERRPGQDRAPIGPALGQDLAPATMNAAQLAALTAWGLAVLRRTRPELCAAIGPSTRELELELEPLQKPPKASSKAVPAIPERFQF